MGRAPCCDKANVKKGPWSPEEDAKLKAYIEEHGTGGNWIALPQKIGLKRCGKSCRLRWLNYLRPNIIHGGFSEEEDNIICNLYISIGSRWSVIAAQLPGRTDNDIKNYWNTKLKKKLLGKHKQSNNSNYNNYNNNQRSSSSPASTSSSTTTTEDPNETLSLSNSAIERLQLHMQLQLGCQNQNQNPLLSFFTHPQLWPKLHPRQEKIIQTLKSLNYDHQIQNPNNYIFNSTFMQTQNNIKNEDMPNKPNCLNIVSKPLSDDDDDGDVDAFEPRKQDYHPSYPDANSDQGSGGNLNNQVVTITNFQEVDDFLNDDKYSQPQPQSCFMPQTDQIVDFDNCFKDLGLGGGGPTSKDDGLIWWPSQKESYSYLKSASSSTSSWDSSSVIQSDQLMFRDYDLGYNL